MCVMSYDTTSRRVLMFGGSPGYWTDLWAWDGSNWSIVPAPSTSPVSKFVMAFDKTHKAPAAKKPAAKPGTN